MASRSTSDAPAPATAGCAGHFDEGSRYFKSGCNCAATAGPVLTRGEPRCPLCGRAPCGIYGDLWCPDSDDNDCPLSRVTMTAEQWRSLALRAEVERLKAEIGQAELDYERLKARVAALETALREIAESGDSPDNWQTARAALEGR